MSCLLNIHRNLNPTPLKSNYRHYTETPPSTASLCARRNARHKSRVVYVCGRAYNDPPSSPKNASPLHLYLFAAARPGGEMHPAQRAEADVGARVALVAALRESRPAAQRPSYRGPAQSQNGEYTRHVRMFKFPLRNRTVWLRSCVRVSHDCVCIRSIRSENESDDLLTTLVRGIDSSIVFSVLGKDCCWRMWMKRLLSGAF